MGRIFTKNKLGAVFWRIYPSKRMLGVHNISLGMCFNYSLGIAFIGEEKRNPSREKSPRPHHRSPQSHSDT